MRTLIPICAMLMWQSCGSGPGQDKVHPTSGDNSPIIIADGSVHVGVANFSPGNDNQHAIVKWSSYQPTNLGYRCDPFKGQCKSDCTLGVKPKCSLALGGHHSWSIDVSDGGAQPVASLAWNYGVPDEIDIGLPNGYSVTSGWNGGVDMVASANNIQSVTVTVDGVALNKTLDCLHDKSACVVVDYYCAAGCSK